MNSYEYAERPEAAQTLKKTLCLTTGKRCSLTAIKNFAGFTNAMLEDNLQTILVDFKETQREKTKRFHQTFE